MMSAVLFLSLVHLFHLLFFFVKSNNEFGWCGSVVFSLDSSIVALMKFPMLKLHVNHFMLENVLRLLLMLRFQINFSGNRKHLAHISYMRVRVCVYCSVCNVLEFIRRVDDGQPAMHRFSFYFWERKGSQQKNTFHILLFYIVNNMILFDLLSHLLPLKKTFSLFLS